MSSYRLFALVAAVSLVLAVPAFAAKGGGGKDGNPATAAGCTVAGSVVNATGLPTDQVINFMVTDASGTSGWVLGHTTDGTWSVSVPAQNGATSYQFVSQTWGSNGTKYTAFASCSS